MIILFLGFRLFDLVLLLSSLLWRLEVWAGVDTGVHASLILQLQVISDMLHIRCVQLGILAPHLLPVSLPLWSVSRFNRDNNIGHRLQSWKILLPGMCEKPETVKFLNCQDVVLLWLWPVLSLIGLVTNYYFNDFIQFELFKILSLMFKHSSCSLYGLLKFSCYKRRISSASLPPSSPPPAPEKKNIENNVGEIFSKLKSIQSDLSESLHNESDHGVIRYSLPLSW